MVEGQQTSIDEHFASLHDPRADRGQAPLLVDIIAIAVCAVLCGADGRVAVATFGRAKVAWLRTFLALPEGIPSHETFGRVFARLDPAAFQRCFRTWVGAVVPDTDGHRPGGTRALDGKAALHLVSAWACGSGLVLGQVAADDKPNAITAIPAGYPPAGDAPARPHWRAGHDRRAGLPDRQRRAERRPGGRRCAGAQG